MRSCTKVLAYTPQGAANTQKRQRLVTQQDPPESGSTRLKLLAQQEAAACLTEIYNRLGEYNPKPKANAKPGFLAEQFDTGEGVRKDTYANIGASNTSSLHLAELRSNKRTDHFL